MLYHIWQYAVVIYGCMALLCHDVMTQRVSCTIVWPLVKHAHTSFMFHITLWLYASSWRCCVMCGRRRPSCWAPGAVMLLLSPPSLSRTARATKALRVARSQHQPESSLLPLFLVFVSNTLFSPPRVPLLFPMQQTKAKHTHNFNLLSGVKIITPCQRERERERFKEGGEIKDQKKRSWRATGGPAL